MYFWTAGRLLCEVPDHWCQERLLEYWERAMEGQRGDERDVAFARFLCAQFAADDEPVLDGEFAPEPDQIRIGRLALAHRLLSRGEVAWVLRFQRAARVHRRRCFGEVAAALGLWPTCTVARLLAVQAERRRGLARAVAGRLGLSAEQLLAAERSFFGLQADRALRSDRAPFDELMAA